MARNGIYLARAREQIAQQRAENEREHRRCARSSARISTRRRSAPNC